MKHLRSTNMAKKAKSDNAQKIEDSRLLVYGILGDGTVVSIDGKTPVEDETALWNALCARLYVFPSAEHVMTVINDFGVSTPLLGGKLAIPAIERLKAEAKILREMTLWSVMESTLADQAAKTMFNNSKDFDDMRTGKAILMALGVFRNILDHVEKAPLPAKAG